MVARHEVEGRGCGGPLGGLIARLDGGVRPGPSELDTVVGEPLPAQPSAVFTLAELPTVGAP